VGPSGWNPSKLPLAHQYWCASSIEVWTPHLGPAVGPTLHYWEKANSHDVTSNEKRKIVIDNHTDDGPKKYFTDKWRSGFHRT
jgi:hypothetical protein